MFSIAPHGHACHKSQLLQCLGVECPLSGGSDPDAGGCGTVVISSKGRLDILHDDTKHEMLVSTVVVISVKKNLLFLALRCYFDTIAPSFLFQRCLGCRVA